MPIAGALISFVLDKLTPLLKFLPMVFANLMGKSEGRAQQHEADEAHTIKEADSAEKTRADVDDLSRAQLIAELRTNANR